jgi:hypothetical protein
MNLLPIALAGLLWAISSAPSFAGDDILFIGNSFTQGVGDPAVSQFGGVPQLVKAIAAAKGKDVLAGIRATGGMGWEFHLSNPQTDLALKSLPWNSVVIQDYSTKATELTPPGIFIRDGEAFYRRIAQEAPGATIVLYETWAYEASNPFFRKAGAGARLFGPAEMISEIARNYRMLQAILQAKDSHRTILLAPVGEAFARCVKEHPEIHLYNAADHKHASKEGSYLAALVIYATIFHDSPEGAPRDFTGFSIDSAEAQNLQVVASEITGKS